MHLLEYRFRCVRKLGIFSDIYDGEEYVKQSEFFESPYNVSFALNFVGAPKFKSSSVQVWPVMLHLNELPPHIRQLGFNLLTHTLIYFVLVGAGNTFFGGDMALYKKASNSRMFGFYF